MNTTETIGGLEVNVVRSKAGVARRAAVMLGDSDKSGMRARDVGSAEPRKAARLAVAEALGIDAEKVRAVSRYTCLSVENGMAVRRDSTGRTIGTYFARRDC